MATEYLPVSWSTYQTHAQIIAAHILANADPVDEIIAIARGGLTLGHILSDFLAIPISIFSIQSYEDVHNQGEVKITSGLQTSIDGKHILVVDDVADSGKTLVRAREYLAEFKPKKITTATLFYKPQSVYKPDFFAEETPKWILFPTEVRETISYIFKTLQKDGKSTDEIETFLKSLHYTQEQIAFVKTFHLTNNS